MKPTYRLGIVVCIAFVACGKSQPATARDSGATVLDSGADAMAPDSSEAGSACQDVSTSATATLDVSPDRVALIPASFAGFNTEDGISAMSPTHGDYRAKAASLSPGFLRWSAGTPSQSFSWSTRTYNSAWPSDWFDGTQLNRWEFLLANMNPSAGYLDKFDQLRSASGASGLIIVINTAWDTAATAGAVAAYCKVHNIAVTAYELGNEPWAIQQQTHWSNGYSYMSWIESYVDAIVASDPGKDIILPMRGENFDNATSPWVSGWDTGATGVGQWFIDHASWVNISKVTAMSVHTYPCPAGQTATATPKTLGFDTNSVAGLEGCLKQYLVSNASPWAQSVMNGVAGFTGRKVFLTEFNSGQEGNTTDLDRPNLHSPGPPAYIRGRRFNAVFAGEAMTRYASAGFSGVAFQKLYGNYFSAIDAKNHNLQWVAAHNPVDQTTAVFDLYLTASGVGLQIINRAINSRSGVYPVAVSGDSNIAGTAFSNGDGHYALLVTNRGAHPIALNLQLNGATIGSSIKRESSGGDSDENWMDGDDVPGKNWLSGDQGGTDNTNQVPSAGSCVEPGNVVTVGPYAVASFVW